MVKNVLVKGLADEINKLETAQRFDVEEILKIQERCNERTNKLDLIREEVVKIAQALDLMVQGFDNLIQDINVDTSELHTLDEYIELIEEEDEEADEEYEDEEVEEAEEETADEESEEES